MTLDTFESHIERTGVRPIVFQQYGAELDGYVLAFDTEAELTAYKRLFGYERADGTVIPRGDRIR